MNVYGIIVALVFLVGSMSLAETPSDLSKAKARDLYNRITGVKLNLQNATLLQMAQLIEAQNTLGAARIAINSLDFYNVNLYLFFAPKSVRSESRDVPLNDFIAMGIANTAMDRPYTEMVKGDFSVEFKPLTSLTTESTVFSRPTGAALRDIAFDSFGAQRQPGRQIAPTRRNLAGTITEGNLRIAQNAQGAVLNQRNQLVGGNNRAVPAAGALTSEKFLAEHAIAGTNRRLVHYTFKEFLCRDIKEWRDGNERISDTPVTKDVPRLPGGNALAYHNECRTCHQVMDPLRKAFSGFDYTNNSVQYTDTAAQKLLRQNEDDLPAGTAFRNPFGSRMMDNGGYQAWENKAIYDSNGTYFGWQGALSGTGVSSFGEMVSMAKAYSTCAVEQVWNQICATSLVGPEGDKIKSRMGEAFKQDGYNLRNLFAQVALDANCNGGLYVASGNGVVSGAGGGSGTNPTPTVITFNIPAGTGDGAWNTAQNPLVVSMGTATSRTIRIVNLDSTTGNAGKVLHSNGGAFCAHQNPAAPLATNGSYDCAITAAAVGTDTCADPANPLLYNHQIANRSARFCVRIVQ